MVLHSSPPKTARHPTYKDVAEHIQERLDAKRGTQARLAEALDMDSGTFRHHMNRREGMQFDIQQLAKIAEVLEAPKGFPWLSWAEAELFEAFEQLSPDAQQLLKQLTPKRS